MAISVSVASRKEDLLNLGKTSSRGEKENHLRKRKGAA